MNIPYINTKLAGSPLNWVIVGSVATIWLLAFHVIMTGFDALSSNGTVGSAPGNVTSPLVGGNSAGPVSIESVWTNDFESRYSEDDGLTSAGAYY